MLRGLRGVAPCWSGGGGRFSRRWHGTSETSCVLMALAAPTGIVKIAPCSRRSHRGTERERIDFLCGETEEAPPP